jgi:hypothetical protein
MLANFIRRGTCLLPLWLALAVSPDAQPASPVPHKELAPSPREREAALGRPSRFLSPKEIFLAIRDDLARRGMRESGILKPEDLKVQFAAPVSGKDPGLQVRKIAFDPIRRETVFELWTSKQPRLLPFRVAARWDPQAAGLVPPYGKAITPESGTRRPVQGGRGLGPTKSRPPVLAKPRRPATLIMLGHDLRITLTVMPLQPGTRGQCILVRDTLNSRVMKAEVVAEGLLRADF